jgi:hypothetical protein
VYKWRGSKALFIDTDMNYPSFAVAWREVRYPPPSPPTSTSRRKIHSLGEIDAAMKELDAGREFGPAESELTVVFASGSIELQSTARSAGDTARRDR